MQGFKESGVEATTTVLGTENELGNSPGQKMIC